MSCLYNSTGYPIYNGKIFRGKDCYVFDGDGKAYLDLEAGVWCLALGHGHPRILSAMQEQMERICHVGYKYNVEFVEEAAEKILEITGISTGKCVFLSSGSEAVEYGIKIAKMLRPGKKCLCLANQYFSAYGIGSDLSGSEWIRISWDYKEEKSLNEWLDLLSSTVDFREVGVFVFEAGNSGGLVKLPPFNLVCALNRKIREANVLTVVDEITCGTGRTGKWFGYMNYNISPDIVAIGKGIGNGYPVSTIVMKEDLAENALAAGFHYAQSHQNDPLGCRIILEVIRTIEDEDLLNKATIMGEYFRSEYEKIKAHNSYIEEVRGIGLLNCIQFSDKISPEQLAELDKLLFENGVIVGMKPKERILRTYAPLVIQEGMINSYMEILHSCLENLFCV